MPEEHSAAAVPRQLRMCAIFRSYLRRSPTARTIRKVGLWCSLAAVVAFGLAAIADNRDLGFGYYISRRDQLWLLFVAITVCALQAVVYRHGTRKGR